MVKRMKLGALLLSTLLCGAAVAAENPVRWNEQASKDLEKALHQMHDVWNTGDIAALKKHIVGDDVLITFELDPATHKPIRLASREQLWSFVDQIVNNRDAEDATFVLGHPGVKCRATDTFGICTEECSVTVKLPKGVEERHKLWSTATAVKYPDGWKWIQWHMSTGGPVEIYKDGAKVASN